MQPPNFSHVHWVDWARWVLAHGVPELPVRIELEESVPVSYWRGEKYGAVLFVHRFVDTRPDDLDPEDEWDEDELVNLDAELFCRAGDTWEAYGGGGTNWHTDSPAFSRPALDPRTVALSGMYGSGGDADGSCVAVYGYLGEDVAVLELMQDDTVEKHSVIAPLGAAVVAARGNAPFTIRTLAEDGSLIDEITESAQSLTDFWLGN